MRELKGEKLEKELQRLDAMLSYEREYAALAPLCGIDEAGRGPLAGPVAAAAVILPENCRILYLNDSKKLSPARRDALFDEIRERAVSYSIAVIPAERIDEINILQATYEAMRQAVRSLSYYSGAFLPADPHCQGRREKSQHRGRLGPGEGDQGQDDGRV